MGQLIFRGESILSYNMDRGGEKSPNNSSLEVIDVDSTIYILIKYNYIKSIYKK